MSAVAFSYLGLAAATLLLALLGLKAWRNRRAERQQRIERRLR